MWKWRKILPAAGFLLPVLAHAAAVSEICDRGARGARSLPGLHIMIQGGNSISFSDTERNLICGDQSSEEPYRSAWRTVPRAQAEFFLRRFLENRGYFQPKFDKSVPGKLLVDSGAITRATEVAIEGAPAELDFQRHRGIVGRALTPELLDELDQWIKNRLQTLGYPCPQLETQADVVSGRIAVTVHPGAFRNFDGIIAENVPGVRATTLRRFDAFAMDSPFNADFLRLTAERTVSEGTVLSTYFDAICSPPAAEATARQTVVPGQPHILRFGFGANTEGLLLARASWRNTRLGSEGSLFDVSGFASTKEQRIDNSFTWYLSESSPRNYLEPFLQLRHQNEEPFESISVRFQVSPGTTWDGRTSGVRVEGGPVWDFVKTIRGSGPPTTRLLSLETRASIQTHYFEFYRTNPRAGAYSRFTATFNDESFLSDVTAQRLSWEGQALLNWRSYFPPLLIGGVRWSLRTTVTNEPLTGQSLLPSNFRQYLGGIADLRGFGRNELPSNGLGALSLAYAGIELRLANALAIPLEPLAFVDLGLLGASSFSLDPPLYWSPGIGVRWGTPFGSIRATLARGILSSREQAGESQTSLRSWQFYLSFGEEF